MSESELPPVYQPPQQPRMQPNANSSNKRKSAAQAAQAAIMEGRRPSKYQRFISGSNRSDNLLSDHHHQNIMHHADSPASPSKYPTSLFMKQVPASSAASRAKREAKLRYQQYQQHVAAVASGQRGMIQNYIII